MKDPRHHMTKFLKKFAKGKMEELSVEEKKLLYPESRPKEQLVKQKKAAIREEREEHVPSDLSVEEKNRLMKKRVPRRKERSHKKELRIRTFSSK